MSQLNFFLWKGHLHCMQWDGLPIKADIFQTARHQTKLFLFFEVTCWIVFGISLEAHWGQQVTKVSTASNDQTKVPRQAKNKNIILPNIFWWLSHNPRLIGSYCLSVYYLVSWISILCIRGHLKVIKKSWSWSILICDCKTNFDEGVIQRSCNTLEQFQNFKEISRFSRTKI